MLSQLVMQDRRPREVLSDLVLEGSDGKTSVDTATLLQHVEAALIGKKLNVLCKLCEEQLMKCSPYDFGLRTAAKSNASG